jgi:hypothetical protein
MARTQSVVRLRKKKTAAARRTSNLIADPVLIASLVAGPLHATIAAAITPFTTKESLCAHLNMPMRVISATVRSLVDLQLVEETAIDATCSYYTLQRPCPIEVARILGPAKAKLVTTTVITGKNRRSLYSRTRQRF